MLVISLLFFRYTIREEIQADGVLSTISIKRTERGDSALFTCVATNAFGSDDTSVNLIIQEKPETPYGLKVKAQASLWHLLEDFDSKKCDYKVECSTAIRQSLIS